MQNAGQRDLHKLQEAKYERGVATAFVRVNVHTESIAIAVDGMPKALRYDWGKYGMTVNAIAPMMFRSPLTAWMFEEDPRGNTRQFDVRQKNRGSLIRACKLSMVGTGGGAPLDALHDASGADGWQRSRSREDSLFIERGKLAESNAQQALKILGILAEIRHEPATAAEARQMLGPKGKAATRYGTQ